VDCATAGGQSAQAALAGDERQPAIEA
jgi:hypothetical protein